MRSTDGELGRIGHQNRKHSKTKFLQHISRQIKSSICLTGENLSICFFLQFSANKTLLFVVFG